MLAIAVFLVGHWLLCVFCQTFFLHRYGAHKHVHDVEGLGALLPPAHVLRAQGSCPEPARLRDPAPRCTTRTATRRRIRTRRTCYHERVHDDAGTTQTALPGASRTVAIEPEARFEADYPEWPALDRLGQSWPSRIAFMAAYTGVLRRVRDRTGACSCCCPCTS